ncbi:M28 family peptidase [Sphingomonas sp. TREG-RG-20F-R18-01]|uniref:M28 family peptidase n=1 Tax=Sphingomonas sp. TREG-RG-20F-R18-01 TaxID=2914982 RepID=UPI001F58277D|nr:M28 family peptidase [Sphingomonas sp. TREG-RG-20F-R18-01]
MLISLVALAAAVSPISADRIKTDVRTLSSDPFLGRGPGEAGEDKTIVYIAQQFAAAGLEPAGDHGSWYQDVPLVRLDRRPGATLTLQFGDWHRSLALGRDATLGFRNPGDTKLSGAPLVFAGYGIVNARLGWDAYAGIDMHGKVAVVLANDPDFEAGRDLGFEGRRLAFEGRVGEKFAAAAKAGAAGVLVIHEDAAASYPFLQLASGDALPTMVIAPLQPSAGFMLSGWLRNDVAVEMLSHAGLDLAALKVRARDAAFRAFPLRDGSVTASGSATATSIVSHNVLGKLPGASRPDETVLYGAHWDANGQNGPVAGDDIRNGAVDNATGTSELIEVGRGIARGRRTARTVVFAAWTAEEKGLLGSEYYAAHPIYPLATTAAVINLDPHVVLPAARDIELIGGGRVSLEADLRRVAGAHRLSIVDEPAIEAGWYFRSDQFSFAKRGVPAITFRAGRNLVEGGTAKGAALVADYNARRYHQPSDAFEPSWSFAGTVQEATVAYELGVQVANAATWPSWNTGTDYATLRAATNGDRKGLQ